MEAIDKGMRAFGMPVGPIELLDDVGIDVAAKGAETLSAEVIKALLSRNPEVNPAEVDDATWGDYLFMRRNLKGWFWEQWQHSAACRKVFAVRRHTATYEISGSWTLAEGKPLFEAEMKAQGLGERA